MGLVSIFLGQILRLSLPKWPAMDCSSPHTSKSSIKWASEICDHDPLVRPNDWCLYYLILYIANGAIG